MKAYNDLKDNSIEVKERHLLVPTASGDAVTLHTERSKFVPSTPRIRRESSHLAMDVRASYRESSYSTEFEVRWYEIAACDPHARLGDASCYSLNQSVRVL